jgi:hypothetical protein
VIVAGGVVRARDRGIVGEATIDSISQFRVDIAVIGISAIDLDGTLLDFDYREVKVAQTIIRHAQAGLSSPPITASSAGRRWPGSATWATSTPSSPTCRPPTSSRPRWQPPAPPSSLPRNKPHHAPSGGKIARMLTIVPRGIAHEEAPHPPWLVEWALGVGGRRARREVRHDPPHRHGRAFHGSRNGGPGRIRTCDQTVMSGQL